MSQYFKTARNIGYTIAAATIPISTAKTDRTAAIYTVTPKARTASIGRNRNWAIRLEQLEAELGLGRDEIGHRGRAFRAVGGRDRAYGAGNRPCSGGTACIDRFVSLHAPLVGGELLTKPITFAGNQLSLNVSTSAAGSVRIEIQNSEGQSLPGFALDDCHAVYGDDLECIMAW